MILGYHATTQRIAQIDKISFTAGGDYGPGLYLATDVRDTAPYGSTVYVATLVPKRLLNVVSPEADAIAMRIAKSLQAEEYFEINSAELRWPTIMEFTKTAVDLGLASWAKIGAYLLRLGYDSIYVPNAAIRQRYAAYGDYYVVLDADVITSWTGYTGP